MELFFFLICVCSWKENNGGKKNIKLVFLCMEICYGVQPTRTGSHAEASQNVDIHSGVKFIIIDEKRVFSVQRYSSEPFISGSSILRYLATLPLYLSLLYSFSLFLSRYLRVYKILWWLAVCFFFFFFLHKRPFYTFLGSLLYYYKLFLHYFIYSGKERLTLYFFFSK